MYYLGKVQNGKIELDPPNRLPEGMQVRVEPVPAAPANGNGVTPHDSVYELADLATDWGPADLSAQHDHYLHGTPKRKNA